MEFGSKVNVHNKFEVTVFDKDSGEVKQTAYAENIVLDAIYTQICNFYTGIFNGIAFGTGTGTLAASRTTLFNYLGSKGCNQADCGTVEEILAFPTSSRKRKITIQPEEYAGKIITEVGIAVCTGYATTQPPNNDPYHEGSGYGFSKIVTHALLDTPIVKTSTDIVVIEATLYFSFGEWASGFYDGNIRWRFPQTNDLLLYLMGKQAFPSVYFYVGNENHFSNDLCSEYTATSSAIAVGAWTRDVANKKVTTPVTRFSASNGNGPIKSFALGSSVQFKGVFGAVLPISGVFENYAITGEAVGTGDGSTTGFDFDWDDIDSVQAIYINGVKTTGYTLEKNKTGYKKMNYGRIGYGVSYGEFGFTSDGKYLAMKKGTELSLNECIDGCFFEKANLATGNEVKGVDISPDGTYIVAATRYGDQIYIFKKNGSSYEKIAKPDIVPTYYSSDAYWGVSFSPDGNYLAIASPISRLNIYKRSGDVFTNLSLTLGSINGGPTHVMFSPLGNYLVLNYSYDGNTDTNVVFKRDGDTFTRLTISDYILRTTNASSFTQDETYLAVAGSTYSLTIYKRSGDVFTKLPNPSDYPSAACNGVAFSPDGRILVATTYDKIIFYYRSEDVFTKTHEVIRPDASYSFGKARFSLDGQYLFVAYGYLMVFKMKSYTPSQSHNIEFASPPASGAVITADYTIDYIPKDTNHVLDLSAAIQWG